jgi:hypothetical protein
VAREPARISATKALDIEYEECDRIESLALALLDTLHRQGADGRAR